MSSKRTITLIFNSTRKCQKLLSQMKRDKTLRGFLDGEDSKTIWMKFDCEEKRELMMKALKSSIPKYKVEYRNGCDQLVVK